MPSFQTSLRYWDLGRGIVRGVYFGAGVGDGVGVEIEVEVEVVVLWRWGLGREAASPGMGVEGGRAEGVIRRSGRLDSGCAALHNGRKAANMIITEADEQTEQPVISLVEPRVRGRGRRSDSQSRGDGRASITLPTHRSHGGLAIGGAP